MIILAGDIGGTKTLLQLAKVAPGRKRVLAEQRCASADFPGLAPMVRSFLARAGVAPASACFGVPGPVREGRAQPVNLPWTLDAAQLQADLGIPRLRLINDFVAVAHGIAALGPADLQVVCPGTPEPRGPIAVLGAGTGLGEAVLHWVGRQYAVLPSEGGHADFAPQDEAQIGLLRHLLQRYGHASWERVLSGPGLVNIYEYLRSSGYAPESPAVQTAMAAGDPGAAIAAHSGSDPLCARTIELFLEIYAAEAGNLALKALATGGVYLAGGVTGHLAPHFASGRFQAAFVRKGRMGSFLEGIPVYLVTNPKVGLIGAAAVAARRS